MLNTGDSTSSTHNQGMNRGTDNEDIEVRNDRLDVLNSKGGDYGIGF